MGIVIRGDDGIWLDRILTQPPCVTRIAAGAPDAARKPVQIIGRARHAHSLDEPRARHEYVAKRQHATRHQGFLADRSHMQRDVDAVRDQVDTPFGCIHMEPNTWIALLEGG
jgi:hypothetical protein